MAFICLLLDREHALVAGGVEGEEEGKRSRLPAE